LGMRKTRLLGWELFFTGTAIPIVTLASVYLSAGKLRAAMSFYFSELTSSLGAVGAVTNPFLAVAGVSGSEIESRVLFIVAVALSFAIVIWSVTIATRDWRDSLLSVFVGMIAMARLFPVWYHFDASHLIQGLPTAYLAPVFCLRGRSRWSAIMLLASIHLGVGLSMSDGYYAGRWQAEPPFEVASDGVLRGLNTPQWQFSLQDQLITATRLGRTEPPEVVAVPYSPLLTCLVDGFNPTRSDIYFPGSTSTRALVGALSQPTSLTPLPEWFFVDRSAYIVGFHDISQPPGLFQTVRNSATLTAATDNWEIYKKTRE